MKCSNANACVNGWIDDQLMSDFNDIMTNENKAKDYTKVRAKC